MIRAAALALLFFTALAAGCSGSGTAEFEVEQQDGQITATGSAAAEVEQQQEDQPAAAEVEQQQEDQPASNNLWHKEQLSRGSWSCEFGFEKDSDKIDIAATWNIIIYGLDGYSIQQESMISRRPNDIKDYVATGPIIISGGPDSRYYSHTLRFSAVEPIELTVEYELLDDTDYYSEGIRLWPSYKRYSAIATAMAAGAIQTIDELSYREHGIRIRSFSGKICSRG